MSKIKKTGAKNQQQGALMLPLGEELRGALFGVVMSAGLQVLQQQLEGERTEVCGPRYQHDAERKAHRAGHAQGELILGGRRVQVKRPRVRDMQGHEVMLPSWQAFRAEDPLMERAVEQMVLGVATRKYARSLEPVAKEVQVRGTSKSAVSRRFVQATRQELASWMDRELSSQDIRVLMVDGVHFCEHVILVAMGIDAKGQKHVLGVWEGATENQVACRELLSHLVDRGLRADRSLLVVIDGGKGLRKAIRDVFGKYALVQRCQVHKKRNVMEHLPEEKRPMVKQAMTEAYQLSDAEKAQGRLEKLAKRLELEHPGAAGSLREGLKETLTVMGLGLPEALERTLRTTNLIENIMGTVRRVSRRVAHWRDGEMILRWVGAGLREATKGFHRVRGHQGMKHLVAALEKRDRELNETIDMRAQAA
jgi:transposase-like protein